MIYALINDNKVVELADLEDIDFIIGKYQQVLPLDYFERAPSVGWIFASGKCYPDLKPITAIQLRQALVMSGISLDTIAATLDSLPDPTRSLAKIAWEYAVTFDRNDKLVETAALMLGLNDDQIDALWLGASKI